MICFELDFLTMRKRVNALSANKERNRVVHFTLNLFGLYIGVIFNTRQTDFVVEVRKKIWTLAYAVNRVILAKAERGVKRMIQISKMRGKELEVNE